MEVVEYTGKTYKYKVVGERSFGGFTKVKLQSFGVTPFEFEVDKKDLFEPKREQWTCNCGELWEDCKRNKENFSRGRC